MTGEERRKWLQRIRRRIAEHNDIIYMQSDRHEQDCGGDCKVCQAEARYIDSELRRKAKMGEDIRLSSILSELLMDVDLTIGVCGKDALGNNIFDNNKNVKGGDIGKPHPSFIYIQSVTEESGDSSFSGDNSSNKKDIIQKGNKNKQIMLIEEMNLTIHLDNTLKSYGIRNTDELYVMLKGDSMNMKKKLRGGYKFLIERLKELGYEITEEMG